MKFILIFLTLSSIAFLPAAEEVRSAAPTAQTTPEVMPEVNAVLASVDGEPICLADVLPLTRAQEYQAYASLTGAKLAGEIRKIREEAVNGVIDRKLLLAEYKRDPFPIPAQTVEQRLDEYAERMGCRSRQEFTAMLRREKSSIDKLRSEVKDQVIAEIMVFRKLQVNENITPKEVFEFFKSDEARWVSPERIELGMILLDPALPDEEKTQRTEMLMSTLRSTPENFGELAARYSIGPGAAEGGNLGLIERHRLRSEFAAAVIEPADGKIYGPISTEDGTVFLKVIRYEPGSETAYKTVFHKVRAALEAKRRSEAIKNYVAALREKATIRYFF